MLDDKVAVIYGAGGSIGGAVARAFTRVFLAGRTETTLDEVAEDIRSDGGEADTAIVDALDEQAVDYRDEVIAATEEAILLNRTESLADVGNVAAFVASDQARTMTATEVNISCGRLWSRCVA